MNLRLSILLVTVLVLVGGTFLMFRYFGPTERRQEEPWLYHMDEDRIVRIEVQHAGQSALYSRDPGSTRWYIRGETDIPVFIEKWSGTPLLLSGPRVDRTLTEIIDDAAKYGLDPPESVVKVSNRAEQTFEFHMGSTTPDEDNQYVRLVGSPTLFTVPAIWAEVINRLATEPPYLQLFQLEEGLLAVAIITDGDTTITYGKRKGNLWGVIEPDERTLDQSKWGDTEDFLSNPRANQIIEEEIDNPEDYGLEPPQTTVRLRMLQGADKVFFLGDTTPDGSHRYAYAEGDPTLYAMPNDLAERITDLVASPPYGTEEASDDTSEQAKQ